VDLKLSEEIAAQIDEQVKAWFAARTLPGEREAFLDYVTAKVRADEAWRAWMVASGYLKISTMAGPNGLIAARVP
jgi:hypothetical protein